MVVDWPPAVRGIVAVVPPLLAVLVVLAPYDGYFEDRPIFLYVLGGLLLGTILAFLDLMLLLTSQGAAGTLGAGTLLFVVGGPLLNQLGKTVALNLRRYQGDPKSLFHGAALGAGVGAMMTLAYGETVLPVTADLLRTGGGLLLIGGGVSFLEMATGVLLGAGVAQGGLLKRVPLAVLAAVPMAGLVVEYVLSRHPLWALAGLLYGLALLTWASRTLLPQGLTEEERKDRRRRLRAGRLDA